MPLEYSDDIFEDNGGGGDTADAAGGGGSSLFCPNCGSKAIEHQDASGAAVCMDCGVVVEENAIVSSVEFVEGAGGSSSMVGQFVSATSSKAYTAGGGGGGRGGRGWGFSRDSRETTLNNGRRRIQEIASRLRLSGHFIDAAHRLFTIAVEKNFVQGRRTTHVVASCLYIVCRQEKSQHMLIDFSDALQVNVYSLGTCFLKFRRLLGLKLEIIDPALYVYRFAAHLDLDEKANAVSLTALRLVARMKRDWIVAGRRPAGICAAALLIAARAHGFSKHHQDVTRILKVCGMTVTSRVREFELTPAAQLTLEDFHKKHEENERQQDEDLLLKSEADPPSYSRNKIKEARVRAIQQGDVALLESGALDDPLDGPRKARMWRGPERETKHKNEMKELYSNLEQELVGEGEATTTPALAENAAEQEEAAASPSTAKKQQPAGKDDDKEEKQIVAYEGALKVPARFEKVYPRNGSGKLVMLADHATQEEMQAPVAPVEAKLSLTDWKKDMPDSMENELDDIFRTDEEEMQKEAIFNKINKDYLEQQERKDSLKQMEESGEAEQDQDDAAQVEGHARYQKKRSRRKRKNGGDPDDNVGGEEGATVEDQLRATLSSRKISRKINYDALSSIFDEDGSLGNVDGGTSGGGGIDDAMYEGL